MKMNLEKTKEIRNQLADFFEKFAQDKNIELYRTEQTTEIEFWYKLVRLMIIFDFIPSKPNFITIYYSDKNDIPKKILEEFKNILPDPEEIRQKIYYYYTLNSIFNFLYNNSSDEKQFEMDLDVFQ